MSPRLNKLKRNDQNNYGILSSMRDNGDAYNEVWLHQRHYVRHGVSNHRHLNCLINRSSADQRKHRSSSTLALLRGIQRSPMNSPHKWPVTQKKLPFDNVIMLQNYHTPCEEWNQVWDKVTFVVDLTIVNTLSPRQNGRHFSDDIFKCIFLNENIEISIKIPLKFVSNCPINIFQHCFR